MFYILHSLLLQEREVLLFLRAPCNSLYTTFYTTITFI